MGKPIDLFRGQAPQAMTLMGQGVADAYARAGEIEGNARSQLGQTLGSAFMQAASIYGQNAALEKKFNANYKAVKTDPELFGMTANDVETIGSLSKGMSASEKYDFLSTFMGQAVAGKQQQYKLDQIGTQIRGELTNTALSNSLKSGSAPTLDSGITGGSNSSSLLQGVPSESPSSQSSLPLPFGNTGGSVQLLRPDAQSLLDQAIKSLQSSAPKKRSYLKSFIPE